MIETDEKQIATDRATLLLELHARKERAEQLEAEDKKLDGELEKLKGQEYQRGE